MLCRYKKRFCATNFITHCYGSYSNKGVIFYYYTYENMSKDEFVKRIYAHLIVLVSWSDNEAISACFTYVLLNGQNRHKKKQF